MILYELCDKDSFFYVESKPNNIYITSGTNGYDQAFKLRAWSCNFDNYPS